MSHRKVFIAYPSSIGNADHVIRTAVEELGQYATHITATPWSELDIAGHFIDTEVREKIREADLVVADISRLNFNVTYEVGLAMGCGKRIIPILNTSLEPDNRDLAQLGIFDTLGYKPYQNSGELRRLISSFEDVSPTITKQGALDRSAPVYLLDTLSKTDTALRVTSRLKKAKIRFRSFDPKEQSRLSAIEAYRNVAASVAVVVNLLSRNSNDWHNNNLRAAFIAGLADGLERVCLMFQEGEDPVPLDYRELVKVYRSPSDIDQHINALAPQVVEALQERAGEKTERDLGLLESMDFGEPAAENEMGSLSKYYLETDEFNRTLAGSVRLVVGRKGSGKTALFIRARDQIRRKVGSVVLDLKPDGHQLKRFKYMVLQMLAEPAREHTAKAFWEYLLQLEIAHKLLENDRERHLRDHTLFEPYRRLEAVYQSKYRAGEVDFSERMLELIDRITADFGSASPDTPSYLSAEQVTNLVYKHDILEMHEALVAYLSLKGALWILFDNIDKGWPTHGVDTHDIMILRSLLDAAQHVEQSFRRRRIDSHAVIFVRNDVFELLVDQSPDRGKESRVSLDWTDPDLLKEFVRRRIVANPGVSASDDFDTTWRRVCVSHVEGMDSADYVIERCLMRPRNLLTLLNYAKAYAVNLGKGQIGEDEFRKACENYSGDIVNEVGLEIQDVFPTAPDCLYGFIGADSWLNVAGLRERLVGASIDEQDVGRVIELLCWFSFLGVVRTVGDELEERFIYQERYDMKKFRRLAKDFADESVTFAIHKAFHPFLEINA